MPSSSSDALRVASPRRWAPIALAVICAGALIASLASAAPAAAAPKAAQTGPVIAKCGKFKKKAAKNRCLAQNKANRVAFNQIKNGKYVGQRGDGRYVEWTYCGNGKYQSITEGTSGRAISKGKSWRVKDAVVRQGGKWVNAFITGEGGFEVAIQRRGVKWMVAVGSLGRILYPGDATRENAAATCPALDVG